MFFNFNFNPSIGSNSINIPNPNPNPSFDRVTRKSLDEFEALNFKDVADYLMLEEDVEERDLSSQLQENKLADVCDESASSSVLVADDHKKYRKRVVKKYNNVKQEFRVAFRTRSKIEIMDDGFKWRKYGKKRVKSSPNLRNYYKCSEGGCSVKKRVERDGNDSSYVITSYQGLHNHGSPSSSTTSSQVLH